MTHPIELLRLRRAANFEQWKRNLTRPVTPKGATARYLELLQEECQKDHDEERNGDWTR